MEEFAEPSVCAVCPPTSMVSKPMPALSQAVGWVLRRSAAQSGESRSGVEKDLFHPRR